MEEQTQEVRRLGTLVKAAHDAIYTQAPDGTITSWNPGAQRLYGYSAEEAIGQPYLTLVPAVRRDEFEDTTRRLLQGEPVKSFESQQIRKDGEIIVVSLGLSPIKGAAGQVVGIATVGRDVTAQKQTEQILHESEARTAAILEQLPVAVGLVDPTGRVTAANALWREYALRQIPSRDPEGVQRWRVFTGDGKPVPPNDWPGAQALRGESVPSMDCLHTRDDGHQVWRRVTSAPFRTEAGKVIGAICIIQDIDAQKRAEEALRIEKERIRAILDTAPDAIITIDQRGTIQNVNPATEEMFGYARDELVDENIKILMPQPYHDEHDGYIARYLETGEAHIIGIGREVIGKRSDGSIFPVDLSVSKHHDGHSRLFTGIIRDISDRRDLQRQVLEAAGEEDRRIGYELHDGVQQEITGMTLYAGTLIDVLEELEKREIDGRTLRLLEEAEFLSLREAADKLSKELVNTRKHVRKLSHGILPVQIDAQGLNAALAELADSTDALQGVTCHFHSPEVVRVADNTTATHLYRIAQEAVHNALRHSQGNQIDISLVKQDDQPILEISDNGIGIEPGKMGDSGPHGPTAATGLRIMQYRAKLIGATFRIGQNEQGGTLVRCEVLRR